MFADVKPKTPKPWSVKFKGVKFNGLSFTSLETVKIRIEKKFREKEAAALAAASRLRPQQYGVVIAAYHPDGYRYDSKAMKDVKQKSTPPREIYSTQDAKVSGVKLTRGWGDTTVSFALALPADFAEKSAAIGIFEELLVEISTPQLSLV